MAASHTHIIPERTLGKAIHFTAEAKAGGILGHKETSTAIALHSPGHSLDTFIFTFEHILPRGACFFHILPFATYRGSDPSVPGFLDDLCLSKERQMRTAPQQRRHHDASNHAGAVPRQAGAIVVDSKACKLSRPGEEGT